jgi:hypothetical protein
MSAYSPSSAELEYFRFCVSRNLVVLSICKSGESGDFFHLTLHNPNGFIEYFLIDFAMPANPANRKVFTEREAYVQMFSIYKEFYMRNNNIKEDVIAEVKVADAKKLEPKPVKLPKAKKAEKDWINFPFKEIDLFELIDICEKESTSKNATELSLAPL